MAAALVGHLFGVPAPAIRPFGPGLPRPRAPAGGRPSLPRRPVRQRLQGDDRRRDAQGAPELRPSGRPHPRRPGQGRRLRSPPPGRPGPRPVRRPRRRGRAEDRGGAPGRGPHGARRRLPRGRGQGLRRGPARGRRPPGPGLRRAGTCSGTSRSGGGRSSARSGAWPRRPRRGGASMLAVRRRLQFDIPLFLATLVLVAIGIVMVFSSSGYVAEETHHQMAYYLVQQVAGAAAGFLVIILLLVVRKRLSLRPAFVYGLVGLTGLPAHGLPGHAEHRPHQPLDRPPRLPLPAVRAGQDQPHPLPGLVLRDAQGPAQRLEGPGPAPRRRGRHRLPRPHGARLRHGPRPGRPGLPDALHRRRQAQELRRAGRGRGGPVHAVPFLRLLPRQPRPGFPLSVQGHARQLLPGRPVEDRRRLREASSASASARAPRSSISSPPPTRTSSTPSSARRPAWPGRSSRWPCSSSSSGAASGSPWPRPIRPTR